MADVDCLFKPGGRSLRAGFSHNLAKRLAIFPMLLFILSRDNARSRLLRLDGSSLLEELSEVLCTSPDVAVFSADILEKNRSNCRRNNQVSFRI